VRCSGQVGMVTVGRGASVGVPGSCALGRYLVYWAPHVVWYMPECVMMLHEVIPLHRL
jgi:hypothetical protein